METFDDFLKRYSIKELKDEKDKPYWQAIEKEGKAKMTALTGEGIMWTLKGIWSSVHTRTYHDDKGRWWVGEKGSRKGFKIENDAIKHQTKIIAKYGAK